MRASTADVVICGAGIAGISAAYHLSRIEPGLRAVLLDERPPLSLTSDKSTECYRNWWPDASMIGLIDRSIDWLERWAEETGNTFGLNRRGYLYASMHDDGAQALLLRAQAIAALGAGALRQTLAEPDESSQASADHPEAARDRGADYSADPALIRTRYPYLSPETRAVMHIRRAGWLRAHELGTWLLAKAEQAGVILLSGRLSRMEMAGGAVRAVGIETSYGFQRVATPGLVNAAGPLAGEVSALAGVDLPLTWELHLKAAFRDSARILPRRAPLVILADAQRIDWSEEEAELLRQTPDDRTLLELLPGGAHIRPEGPTESPYCVLLWPYRLPPARPVFPIAPDPAYAEVAMRGMSRLIPGLRGYITRMPPTTVDGGYYTRTPDNLPLIGPTPIAGYFLMAAFSGFGVMGSPAAGELLAESVSGQPVSEALEPFRLDRFESSEVLERLRPARETGEL